MIGAGARALQEPYFNAHSHLRTCPSTMAPNPKLKAKRHATPKVGTKKIWKFGAAGRRTRRVLSAAGIMGYTKPGMAIMQQVVACYMADLIYRMALFRRDRKGGEPAEGKYHKTTEQDFMGAVMSSAAMCPLVPGRVVFDTDGASVRRDNRKAEDRKRKAVAAAAAAAAAVAAASDEE